ncbi:MAG: thymidylate synthase [Planctomycetota bacterium]
MTESKGLTPVYIEAFNLDDAWFQCLSKILDFGHTYTITRGSFQGQRRLEFDYVAVQIKKPGQRPIIPMIPEGSSIPAPTSMEYVEQYMNYLLTGVKQAGEDYTYGERLVDPRVIVRLPACPVRGSDSNGVRLQPTIPGSNSPALSSERAGSNCQSKVPGTQDAANMFKEMPLDVNQIEEVIKMYKKDGHGTNQATMEIGMPSDIKLVDPPCLRIIDTRIRYGKLHFMLYFRSWDLWAGFPSNLAGLQLLKEYMAGEIGVEDGEIIAASKGMHLYEYTWEVARMRTQKT